MNTWIVADTEDNSKELLCANKSGFSKKVTQIAAISNQGESYYSKGNVIDFLKWLGKQRNGKTGSCGRKSNFLNVYFHNLRYDIGNLFGRALDLPDITLIGGRLIKARWNGITFLDSLNMWPMSVRKLGEAFGIQKMDFDSASREYVFRDCEIVQRAMAHAEKTANEFGVEQLPATLGSLAVKIWRAMGGSSWFDDSQSSKLAYYGGRVELFQQSVTGSINYYDVNSLYPFCMTKRFPTELKPQKDLDCYGVTEATIKIPRGSIASLPVRRRDLSIYYPIGKITGVWTTHELRAAIANGTSVSKLHSVHGSTSADSFYCRFIREFWTRRLASKSEPEKLFYKLLMNNLYGQQAMSGTITRSVNTFEGDCRDGIPYGRKMLVDTKIPLPPHVNYLHAAYVTSYARIELLKLMNKVDPMSLIYCDTDSIITTDKLPTGDGLGELKQVAKWRWCKTYAPKMYEGPGLAKAKGVPQRLAKEFIDTGRVEFERPFGLREAIIGYDKGNEKQLSVWTKVTKEKRTNYDKKKLIAGRYYPLQHRISA